MKPPKTITAKIVVPEWATVSLEDPIPFPDETLRSWRARWIRVQRARKPLMKLVITQEQLRAPLQKLVVSKYENKNG